jgi:hypothetical protein
MNLGADWNMIVMRYMAMAPMLLVMGVGLVLALRNLPKFPRPCWVLLAALALDGFSQLAMPTIMQTIVSMYGGWSNPPGSQSHHLLTFVYTLPGSLINAVVWGLVLFAIFDRPPPPKFLREDDPDRDILDR